jgi:ATP adenylyltransferase
MTCAARKIICPWSVPSNCLGSVLRRSPPPGSALDHTRPGVPRRVAPRKRLLLSDSFPFNFSLLRFKHPGDSSAPLGMNKKSNRKCWLDFAVDKSTLASRKLAASFAETDDRWMSKQEFPKKELETLWCPWRVEYFEKEPRDREFLEAAARASNDAEHLVITRRKNAFLMMNRYPYAVGHLMAVPYRKTADIASLGDNEIVELWSLVTYAQTLLRATMKAQGFNVGLNLGECAGAGIVDYLHIHIVPRWSGDTNFMPILVGTRMLSEALRALYDKLMEAQAKIETQSARNV